MGIMDALRRAEKRGKDLTQRGVNVAREGLDDAQRRVRQKMRVYPARNGSPNANPPESDPIDREMEDAQRRAIVSVRGEDVKEDDIDKVA